MQQHFADGNKKYPHPQSIKAKKAGKSPWDAG